MTVQNQMLFLSVLITIEFSLPVKNWVSVMNDTMMVRADDNLVASIIVEAFYEIIYVMSFCNMRTEFLTD